MSIFQIISSNKRWSLTIYILAFVVIPNYGNSLISAHCTNVIAKRPYHFNRNSNRTYRLVADEPYAATVKKGQDARFTIRVDKVTPLTITFLSGQSNDTQLYFNESVNLSKYFASDSSRISIPCAPIGQYDIVIPIRRNNGKDVKVVYSLLQPKYQTFSHYMQPSRIRYENRLKKRQVLLQWDKSKLDIHAMKYCIAINMNRSRNSLCDALDSIVDGPASGRHFCSQLKTSDRTIRIDATGNGVACTGQRNKQIVQGLLPNRKYIVDLFGVHAKIGGMTFKLGTTTVLFNRSTPIELSDDRSELGKLTRFDRKAVYTFKSDTPGSSVQFMIVPCGYAITAKIFSQKKLISRIEIDRPQLLRFNGTSHNDRFLLKIFPTNADDIMQNAINFKVIATSKPRFTSIPTLPSITTVEEIKSRRTCTEATIMWHSSPDTHNIKYCVSVIKLKSRNIEDNALTINTCNLSKSQRKLFATIEKCFVPTTTNSNGMERYTVNDLLPGNNYIVQVMLRREQERLPYQTVHIQKSRSYYCLASINNNKLPKTFKQIKRLQKTSNSQQKEYSQFHRDRDNNIIVP